MQRRICMQLLGVMTPSPGFTQKQQAIQSVLVRPSVLVPDLTTQVWTGGDVIFKPLEDQSHEGTNTEKHDRKSKVSESAGTSGDMVHHIGHITSYW